MDKKNNANEAPYFRMTKMSNQDVLDHNPLNTRDFEERKNKKKISLNARFSTIQDDMHKTLNEQFQTLKQEPSTTNETINDLNKEANLLGTTLAENGLHEKTEEEDVYEYKTNASLHPHPPLIDFSKYQRDISYPLRDSIIRTSEPLEEPYKSQLIPAPPSSMKPSAVKTLFENEATSWDNLENQPWYQRKYHYLQFEDGPFDRQPCSPSEKLKILREHEKRLQEAYISSKYENERGPKDKWYAMSSSEFTHEMIKYNDTLKEKKSPRKKMKYKRFKGPVWLPTFKPARNFDGSAHYLFGEAIGNKLSFAGTGEPF